MQVEYQHTLVSPPISFVYQMLVASADVGVSNCLLICTVMGAGNSQGAKSDQA
jgi:hypothetical protein